MMIRGSPFIQSDNISSIIFKPNGIGSIQRLVHPNVLALSGSEKIDKDEIRWQDMELNIISSNKLLNMK